MTSASGTACAPAHTGRWLSLIASLLVGATFIALWLWLLPGWIVFGHPHPIAIAAVAAVALGVHLFVVSYEESTPERSSGSV